MTQSHYEQRISTPAGEQVVEVTESRHRISPGSVVGILLGLGVAFLGAVTLFKTGVGQDLTRPTVTVFGMTQSAAVGLIELTVGLLFILCSAWDDARPVLAVLGVVAVVAGIAGTVASPQIQADLGFSSNTAWFLAMCGVVAIIAGVLPSMVAARRNIREVDSYPTRRNVREVEVESYPKR